ncbi:multidrug effflux MFS transporter [Lapillicoccus sp.]|uniref:multidrug effflux MFS transporter n=1 Tax=Lapillicoccus sp. TaxID=1909287 RepID=UPI0025DBC1BC|nr:multidrug effflux MFS transporter [Lapillicoccus sp.]
MTAAPEVSSTVAPEAARPAPPTATGSSADAMTTRARVKLVIILGAMTALGPLTIDTYLPALPSITRDLQSTSAAVGLTLTGTLVGFALGQLVVGPISDSFGRRRPMMIGVALHVVASILCAVAGNVLILSGFRVLQGIAAASASVVALAIVRDVANGRAFVVMMSRLLLVMGAAPVLAPTLGSQVLRWTEWRGVFVVIAVIAVILLVVTAVALPETLPPERRLGGGVRGSLTAYGALLRDRTFVGLVLVAGLTMTAVFGYVGGSSFVMQGQYGLSVQQFGLVFGAGSIALIIGTQLNPRLVGRWSSARVLGTALVLGTLAAGAMVVTAATGYGGLVGLLVPLWLVLANIGVALPNAPALALARHGDTAGTAAALLGATQFGVAGFVGPVLGLLGLSAVSMAEVIASGLGLALVVYLAVVRPWRLEPVDATAALAAAH